MARRSLALCLAVIGIIAVVAGVLAADRALSAMLPRDRQHAVVVATLQDEVTAEVGATLISGLERTADVAGVRFVTSREALGRLKSELGEHAALLDNVEEGFVPPSLEITLTGGQQLATDVDALLGRLSRITAVQGVDVWRGASDPLAERFIATARRARKVGAIALAMFLLTTCGAFVVRRNERARAEQRVLRAFGIPRRGLLLCVAGPTALATAAGVLLAGAILVRMSGHLGWVASVGSVPHELQVALWVGAAWGTLVTLGRAASLLRSLP